jgi:hypothetical protein
MINHKYRLSPAQMTFRKMRPLQTSTTDQSESSNCQDNLMLVATKLNKYMVFLVAEENMTVTITTI